ncbi:MAG: hypothetical protein KGJ84_00265 [Elusimicrobia bacterium]|nr:hypothetical protein [Elusimicrobiota bacterium]
MDERNDTTEMPHEPHPVTRRRPRLRPGHRFMEPEELTPHERWDRIIELLAVMAMPRTPLETSLAEPVLTSEINNAK